MGSGYTFNPDDFNPIMDVVAIYPIVGRKTLMLQRHADKHFGGYWSSPGGKREAGQTKLQAAHAELQQETNISVPPLEHRRSFNVRYGDFDVVFDTYLVRLVREPIVRINPAEHTAFQWVNLEQYKSLNKMPLQEICFQRSVSSFFSP